MALTAAVVADINELTQAFAIRSAVYLVEQSCPYSEEFDGNDFAATHILGRVDGEPAGTVRVRFFGEFAKFERVSVLPRYRHGAIAKVMLDFTEDLCRHKGFRKIYGHSQIRLVPYWKRRGYTPIEKNVKLVFSDHEYVEVVQEFPPHAEEINLASNPYMMIRREGEWEKPGVLERSADRAPTNPH